MISCCEPKYGEKKDSCEERSPAGKFGFAKRISAEFAEFWSCRKCRGKEPCCWGCCWGCAKRL
eukprot:3383805-Pleurochrysis_carterae.AAC.1